MWSPTERGGRKMTNKLYEVKTIVNAKTSQKYLVVASNVQEALNLVHAKDLKNNSYNPDDSHEIEANSINLDDVASPTILANNGISEG